MSDVQIGLAGLGILFALILPSIIMILYGVIAQVSIAGLFLGGISAGAITTIGDSVVVMVGSSSIPRGRRTCAGMCRWPRRSIRSRTLGRCCC